MTNMSEVNVNNLDWAIAEVQELDQLQCNYRYDANIFTHRIRTFEQTGIER